MNDDIQALLDRIAAGTHTEADLATLRNALRVSDQGDVVQVGKYNVQIGKGPDVRIGDTVVYQGSDAAAIRAVLQEILVESQLRRPFGMVFQAPPLPAHFVPRPEAATTLRAFLGDDTAAPQGVLVISAIHGLGGIGKSTLAAALCHTPQIQAQFADGILWATLGQQPEILALLSTWIHVLGDYQFRPTTIAAASIHLRTLLHDRAALLVVDDAWDPDHVRPFLAGGPCCRALITTRRADVADAVNAGLYELDVMTAEQASTLLAARLGHRLNRQQELEAALVARAVGYLPLALELAAARAARGVTWSEMLRDLEAEVARLEVLEGPRGARLQASLNLSLRALRADDEHAWNAFVWLGVLPEDVLIMAPMATTLWGISPVDAEDLLQLLWNDALLLPASVVRVGDKSYPSYRLHDLMHDMARRLMTSASPQGLGMTLPEAHAGLIERYRAKTQASRWHTLQEDGYIHGYLARHLAKSGQWEELHFLVAESENDHQPWAEARHRIEGSYAGYLSDILLSWAHADEVGATTQSVVAKDTRYLLIQNSIHTLAGNIPPKLLAAMVKHCAVGWTPAAALGYAVQILDKSQRASALRALAPYLPPDLLAQAWDVAHSIRNEYHRAEALRALAPYLPSTLLVEAWATASSIGNEIHRSVALAALAPYLPANMQNAAFDAVCRIHDEWIRAQAFCALAPHLPRDLYGDAIATACKISDKYHRAAALNGLAPYLSSEQLGELRPQIRDFGMESLAAEPFADALLHPTSRSSGKALMAASRIQDEVHRAEVLAALAPNLPADQFTKALSIIDAMWNESARVRAVSALGPRLPPSLLIEAWAMVCAIKDESIRAEGVVGLAAHLPLHILSEAYAVVCKTRSEEIRANALVALAPYLPARVLEDALASAYRIRSHRYRSVALSGIAPSLPHELRESVLNDAWTAARSINDEYVHDETLDFLALRLPPELLPVAWIAARRIGDDHARMEILRVLAPCLSPELLVETLRDSRKLKVESYRTDVLLALMPHLPVARFGEALAAISTITQQDVRRDALNILIPRLSPGLIAGVLTEVSQIEDEGYRAEVLLTLLPHVPDFLQDEALSVVWTIREKDARLNALSILIPRLSVTSLNRVWERTRETRDRGDFGGLLGLMVPHMPPELLEDALGIASAINEEGSRAAAIRTLAPYLTSSLRIEAIAQGQKLKTARNRLMVLAALASFLSPHLIREVFTATLQTLRDHDLASILCQLASSLPKDLIPEALSAARSIWPATSTRASALGALALRLPADAIGPALATAWSEANRIDNAQQRAQQLNVLASQLPQESLAQALHDARDIHNETIRAQAVNILGPYLPVDMLPAALNIVSTIDNKRLRSQVLATMTPHLPDDLLPNAVAIAQAIEDPGKRFVAVKALLPRLRAELREMVIAKEWVAICTTWDTDQPAEMLHELAQFVPLSPTSLHEALAALRRIKSDACATDALCALAPYLPSKSLSDALNLALEIKRDDDRSRALLALVPYLPTEEGRTTLRKVSRTMSTMIGKKVAALLRQSRAKQTDGLGALSELWAEWSAKDRISARKLWLEMLNLLAAARREDLLMNLAALKPVIMALGGEEYAREMARTVIDVGKWWP